MLPDSAMMTLTCEKMYTMMGVSFVKDKSIMKKTFHEVLLYAIFDTCIRIQPLCLVLNSLGRVRPSAPTCGSMIKAYDQAGNVKHM